MWRADPTDLSLEIDSTSSSGFSEAIRSTIHIRNTGSVTTVLNRPIAAIIPWKNRPEIVSTLFQNEQTCKTYGLEIVVVNCGGDHTAITEGLCAFSMPITLVDLPAEQFNRSLAVNIGIASTTADILFVLDADIVLSPQTLGCCLSYLSDGSAVTIERLRESLGRRPGDLCHSEHLKDVELTHRVEVSWMDGKTTAIESYRENLDGSHGGQGQLLVRRRDLVGIGGYNSDLAQWGFEDLDVLIRLQRALGLRLRSVGEAVHLTHGDEVRDQGALKTRESNRRNAALAFRNYARGSLEGTLTEDMSVWAPYIKKTLCGMAGEMVREPSRIE